MLLGKHRSLVGRGLDHADDEIQMAAVALAVEDGIENHSKALATYLTSQPSQRVAGTIRNAVLAHEPLSTGDPYWGTLWGWARGSALNRPSLEQIGPHAQLRPRVSAIAKQIAGILLDIAAVALVLAATWWIGTSSTAFSGFPKGYDAFSHISKIRLLIENFPHVGWNYAWFAGIPHFTGSYPPLFHALAGAIAQLGTSIEQAVLLVFAAGVFLIVICCYATVRVITSSRAAGLLAAGFMAASPSLWSYILDHGLYPRLLALGLASLTTLLVAICAKRWSRLRCAGAIVALGATLGTDLFVGLVGAGTACLLLALLPTWPVRLKVKRALAMTLSPFALNAYFYLPFAFAPGRNRGLWDGDKPAPVETLFRPGPEVADSLPAFLIPALVLLAAISIRLLKRPRTQLMDRLENSLRQSLPMRRNRGKNSRAFDAAAPRFEWAPAEQPEGPDGQEVRKWRQRTRNLVPQTSAAAALAAMALGCLLYAYAGHFGRFPFYIKEIRPLDTLLYAGWLLALASGIALGSTAKALRPWAAGLVSVVVLLAALGSAALSVPVLKPAARDYSGPAKREIAALLPPEVNQHQFRVAATQDAASDWINSKYDVAQVGGYRGEGVMHPDWHFWLEDSLESPQANAHERAFLLDWYAIKWLYAGGPSTAMFDVFNKQSSGFTALPGETPSGLPFKAYEYRHSSPILSASSTSSAMVIGKDSDYDAFLRALAAANINSSQLIAVKGKPFVDDYSLEELKRFPTLVLYGWDAHDKQQTDKLLFDYVQGGGGLVVEAAGSPEVAKLGTWRAFPVSSSSEKETRSNWNFRSHDTPLLEGFDPHAFAPPTFGDTGSWMTASGKLKAWGERELDSQGSPILVSGRLGRGTVVWSGLNLPYHAASHHKAEEAEFLHRIISFASAAQRSHPVTYESTFVNPHLRKIVVNETAAGVLLKENNTENWNASINGRKTDIYPAGPKMMYVPLPRGGTSYVVEFEYHSSAIERAGILFSLATLAALIGYCCRLRLPRRLDPRERAGVKLAN